MEAPFPPSPDREDWKALYRAAILDTNKNAILQKSPRQSKRFWRVLEHSSTRLELVKKKKLLRTLCMPSARSGALGKTPKLHKQAKRKS